MYVELKFHVKTSSIVQLYFSMYFPIISLWQLECVQQTILVQKNKNKFKKLDTATNKVSQFLSVVWSNFIHVVLPLSAGELGTEGGGWCPGSF